MNGHIGLLRCGYRVAGASGAVAGTAARLDRLAREAAPAAMADALDRALGDDPTVYVLREVRSELVLGGEAEPDGRLARRWGDHLARSVLQAIADAGRHGDSANLVRFDDEADHLARFLEDLLDGHAWDHWFHARFSALRGTDPGVAAGTVLLEHRQQAPAVLGLLARRGVLDRLLGLLDQPTLRLLWRGDEDGRPPDDPETARPVFLAALRLIDRLELWDGRRPDTARLWAAWLATGARPPDWGDQTELEATLVDAFRLLADRGHLRPPPDPAEATFQARLELALGELDWLDGKRLRSLLVRLLATCRARRPLPPRPARRQATPRQRELLADLARLVRSGVPLGDGPLDSAGAALRLYAALVADRPRWRDDPAARAVIERLLAAAAGTGNGRAQDPVAALGPDGAALVAAIARSPSAVPEDAVVDTDCAGVFLLLRAAVDARLPRLAERLGAPPIEAVLLGLGLRWAGRGAVVRGRIDPGLALLTGPGNPWALADLRAAWKAVGREQHRRWQSELVALPGLAEPPDEVELGALAGGRLRLTHADRTLALGALGLLRVWGRWLRGFSGSSAAFLLDGFVRRPGQVARLGDDLLVRLEPRPLDVVLAIAGYTDELDLRPLNGTGRLRFQVGGS